MSDFYYTCRCHCRRSSIVVVSCKTAIRVSLELFCATSALRYHHYVLLHRLPPAITSTRSTLPFVTMCHHSLLCPMSSFLATNSADDARFLAWTMSSNTVLMLSCALHFPLNSLTVGRFYFTGLLVSWSVRWWWNCQLVHSEYTSDSDWSCWCGACCVV